MQKNNVLRRIFFTLIYCFLLVAHPSTSQAKKINVIYSGFAFLGEHTDIEKDYKYSSQIYALKDEVGRPVVEATLSKMISKSQCPAFNIVTGQLGDLKSGEGTACAIALDWEDVAVEKIDEGLIKSVYNLHGQVLLFDFISMEIVGCYPFGVRVTDCTPSIPSEEHKLDIFKRLYFDNIGGVSFLGSLSALLDKVKVDPLSSGITFKVADVILEPKAQSFLSKYYPNQRKQAFKIFVAQQFSSFFAQNLQLSILPYTKGKAIGNKMAGRFANGNVFELQIPDGDYPITIAIRGFKKALLDKNATGQSWAYGSFVRLNIKSALGEVINSRIKNAAVKIVPTGQEDTADRSAFIESLIALFNKTTKNISSCDSTWFEKCAEGNTTEKQFFALKEKIAKY